MDTANVDTMGEKAESTNAGASAVVEAPAPVSDFLVDELQLDETTKFADKK